MSVQFSKDDFEKLVWDSPSNSTTKLVALALKWHINNKSNEAFVGVKRLSYMVGRDERTIRRCLKTIERVLCIDILPAEGKSNTYKLRVFETAEEHLIAGVAWERQGRRDWARTGPGMFRNQIRGIALTQIRGIAFTRGIAFAGVGETRVIVP